MVARWLRKGTGVGGVRVWPLPVSISRGLCWSLRFRACFSLTYLFPEFLGVLLTNTCWLSFLGRGVTSARTSVTISVTSLPPGANRMRCRWSEYARNAGIWILQFHLPYSGAMWGAGDSKANGLPPGVPEGLSAPRRQKHGQWQLLRGGGWTGGDQESARGPRGQPYI